MYVSNLKLGNPALKDVRDLGSLVHVFTHLKLTMHVCHIRLETEDEALEGTSGRKWVATENIEGETLSTGMRRCWELASSKM